MTAVKLLGAGCSKCKALEQRIATLKTQYGLEFDLVKVNDIKEILSYGTMATPGLVINGVIKSVGIVPKDLQLLQWLKEQTNASPP